MIEMLPLLALALAVSLDGFAAGFAYGVKNIRIPMGSLILLSVTSGISIWFSMFFGRLVGNLFTPNVAENLGGVILICLGIWLIYQNISIITKSNKMEFNKSNKTVFGDVLDDPIKADFDKSGSISLKEAIILGVALAMDAFSAGFAASLMGFHSLLTPIFVGLCKFLLVPLGTKAGLNIKSVTNHPKIVFLPGAILLLLGLINLI
ncbi:sporulation membrane protein YtaF [Natranaerobius trueperi]|nr:sporulation membrane protein YtaF [Natranaerobius trueperi]